MAKDYVDRHCGFCGLIHPIFERRAIGLKHILWSAIVSLCVTLLLWEKLDSKGFVIFAGWIFVSELTIVIRRILSLPCPHCGFDPALYMKNQPQALAKIIKTLDARKNDPGVWLSQKPAMKLPYRKKPASGEAPKPPEKVA